MQVPKIRVLTVVGSNTGRKLWETAGILQNTMPFHNWDSEEPLPCPMEAVGKLKVWILGSIRYQHHPEGNPGANLKSISHRCFPILVAFEWELTKETIDLPMGCLQGGGRHV